MLGGVSRLLKRRWVQGLKTGNNGALTCDATPVLSDNQLYNCELFELFMGKISAAFREILPGKITNLFLVIFPEKDALTGTVRE